MKFSRILWMVMLVGLGSMVARADSAPVDPLLQVNHNGDPTCPPAPLADYSCFSGTTATTPLVLNSLGAFNFVYDGSTDLTDLYVELNPIILPGIYECTSNIFTSCQTYAPPADAFGLEFYLSGGTITPDEEITAQVFPTPEPKAIWLFGMGLIALLGLRKKSYASLQAAA